MTEAERTKAVEEIRFEYMWRHDRSCSRGIERIDYAIERVGYDIDITVEYEMTHKGYAARGFDPGAASEFDIKWVVVHDRCPIEPWRGIRVAFRDLPEGDRDDIEQWIQNEHDTRSY